METMKKFLIVYSTTLLYSSAIIYLLFSLMCFDFNAKNWHIIMIVLFDIVLFAVACILVSIVDDIIKKQH